MDDYAVLFPGQGSQAPAMFDFALADPRGREAIEAFGAALGVDLPALASREASLFENAVAQPAMVAAALATWAALQAELPPPALMAGYSVGELSAWACAARLAPAAAARLAASRAQAMDRHAPPGSGLLAVRGLPVADLRLPGLFVAIVNEPDHAIFGGVEPDLIAAEAALAARGATLRRLDVHVPSHTPLLAEAAREWGEQLAQEALPAPAVPVLRGIDGRPCRSGSCGADALQQAVMRTIRWDEVMQAIAESGVRVVLEIGPGRALTNLLAQAQPGVAARSVADFRSVRGVADWLQRQLGSA